MKKDDNVVKELGNLYELNRTIKKHKFKENQEKPHLRNKMFALLNELNARPELFSYYTTPQLWNDEHISKKMLESHLNPDSDLASRNNEFIKRSANWIISKFNISKDSRVCDFGCGPGLYTTIFAEAGANVTGIDLSERSIGYAREIAEKKRLNIEYILQNYLDFTTDKKFDLITMIFCDFCVLSPEQKKILIGKFKEFLKPAGYLFMDVSSINLFNSINESRSYEYSENNGFWANEPYYVFLNTFKYEHEKVILSKYSIFEETRDFCIYNWLQCYDLPSLRRVMSENGFMLNEWFSNVAGDEYTHDSKEIAIIAKVM